MQLALILAAAILHAGLDEFLRERGCDFTPSGTESAEGYITPKQRESFLEALARNPPPARIAEVEFNAGHTSELFLDSVSNCHVVSFDINLHPYTEIGVEYMQTQYSGRFRFVEGDSRTSIPAYARSHPKEPFDLIYIDGCHLFAVCLEDILNFKALARKDTLLWIDDVNFSDVQSAVLFAQRLGLIELLGCHSVTDSFGTRAWAEARYLFKEDSR